MNDLISREELLQDMTGFTNGWLNPKPATTYEDLVKQQPTVTAVPLNALCELLDDENIPPPCLNLCMKQHYRCPARNGNGYEDCWKHFLSEWMRKNEY